MKKNHVLIGAFLVLIVIAWVIILNTPTPENNANGQVTPTASADPNGNSVSPTTTPERSDNIIVRTPGDGTTVGYTFQVEGEARVFENVVSYRVTNQRTGQVVASGTTTADAPDVGQFGDYTIRIQLPQDADLQQDDILLLEVFQASPKDGSDTDTVSVELKLRTS